MLWDIKSIKEPVAEGVAIEPQCSVLTLANAQSKDTGTFLTLDARQKGRDLFHIPV